MANSGVRYGLPVFAGGFTGTPNVGLGLSGDGARDYRLGWRLTLAAASGATGFEVSLDATRREAAGEDAEHGVMLRTRCAGSRMADNGRVSARRAETIGREDSVVNEDTSNTTFQMAGTVVAGFACTVALLAVWLVFGKTPAQVLTVALAGTWSYLLISREYGSGRQRDDTPALKPDGQ